LKVLLATNNMVTLSLVTSLLEEADIEHLVLDENMSVLEGSIGIIPRRLIVDPARYDYARRLLEDAGLGKELD